MVDEILVWWVLTFLPFQLILWVAIHRETRKRELLFRRAIEVLLVRGR